MEAMSCGGLEGGQEAPNSMVPAVGAGDQRDDPTDRLLGLVIWIFHMSFPQAPNWESACGCGQKRESRCAAGRNAPAPTTASAWRHCPLSGGFRATKIRPVN